MDIIEPQYLARQGISGSCMLVQLLSLVLSSGLEQFLLCYFLGYGSSYYITSWVIVVLTTFLSIQIQCPLIHSIRLSQNICPHINLSLFVPLLAISVVRETHSLCPGGVKIWKQRKIYMYSGHLPNPTLLAEWYFIYYVPFFLVYISPWESHEQRSSYGLDEEVKYYEISWLDANIIKSLLKLLLISTPSG